MNTLSAILAAHKKDFAPVVPQEFLREKPLVFNFTKDNPELKGIDAAQLAKFTHYVDLSLQKAGKRIGIGGYGEDRILYASTLFKSGAEEPRTVHLAMDIWLPLGTPLYAPLDGTIHSFQDNNHLLDYGPTIILEHKLDGVTFYTLYGHLSRTSLNGLKEGMVIKKGQEIARLGNSEENGCWPTHVHFQIISDMLGKKGDFPGVARVSDKAYYLGLCPDPNLILQF